MLRIPSLTSTARSGHVVSGSIQKKTKENSTRKIQVNKLSKQGAKIYTYIHTSMKQDYFRDMSSLMQLAGKEECSTTHLLPWSGRKLRAYIYTEALGGSS